MTDTARVATLPRPIEVEEFFADPAFSHPSISPDGTRLAYLAPRLRPHPGVGARDRRGARGRGVRHARRPARHHDLLLDRRPALVALPPGHRRQRGLAPPTGSTSTGGRGRTSAGRRPDAPAGGSRVVGFEPVRPAPGYVLVSMNRRPMFLDLFWVEVATGETTVHLEQPEPRGDFLVDRDGRAAFYSYLADDGTQEFSAVDAETGEKRFLRRVGGPEHPMGIQPQQGDSRRDGPARGHLPGLRRPAAGPDRPGDRRGDRGRGRPRDTAWTSWAPRPRACRPPCSPTAPPVRSSRPASSATGPPSQVLDPALRRGYAALSKLVRRRAGHAVLGRERAAVDRVVHPRSRARPDLALRPRHGGEPAAVPAVPTWTRPTWRR